MIILLFCFILFYFIQFYFILFISRWLFYTLDSAISQTCHPPPRSPTDIHLSLSSSSDLLIFSSFLPVFHSILFSLSSHSSTPSSFSLLFQEALTFSCGNPIVLEPLIYSLRSLPSSSLIIWGWPGSTSLWRPIILVPFDAPPIYIFLVETHPTSGRQTWESSYSSHFCQSSPPPFSW